MKNIKLKIIYFLVLAFISVVFTHCKSVELSLLGVLNFNFPEKHLALTVKKDSIINYTPKNSDYYFNGDKTNVFGHILNNKNDSIPEATIILNNNTSLIYKTTTNQEGKFVFFDIPYGKYDVYVELLCKKYKIYKNININSNNQSTGYIKFGRNKYKCVIIHSSFH